jgi:hypothetical protein
MPGQQDRDEATLFDGIGTSPSSLLRFAGDKAPAPLVNGLNSIEAAVKMASQRLRSDGPDAAIAPLAAGLTAARTLRESLYKLGLPEDGVYEIDFRVARTIQSSPRARLCAGPAARSPRQRRRRDAGPAAEGDADRGQPREGQPRSRERHARRR